MDTEPITETEYFSYLKEWEFRAKYFEPGMVTMHHGVKPNTWLFY